MGRSYVMECMMSPEGILFLILVFGALSIFAGALAYADWATTNRFSSYERHKDKSTSRSPHRTAGA